MANSNDPGFTLTFDPSLGEPVLDHLDWASLTGPHLRFAERVGLAVRYHPEVAGFAGLADPHDPQAWRDLATLIGSGAEVVLAGNDLRPPPGWTAEPVAVGVQMIDVSLDSCFDPDAVRLGPSDVPEMLDLIARTRPGPFQPRTIELGRYVGIRTDGRLIAMAGERLRPPGWTEISAVCTDPAHRGQGLATRLIRDVAAGIKERGDRVLLHTLITNTGAIRLYESLGFGLRSRNDLTAFTSPLTPEQKRENTC